MRGVRSKEDAANAPEGAWQAPGGAAWRVQIVDFFIGFYSVFTFCMHVVVVAHVVGAWYTDVEPKSGIVDSALVL